MTTTDPTEPTPTHLLRQQESLREVIESISSELELRPLLTRIVRHACELIGADNGTIGLVDEQRNVVRTEAVYQMPAGELGAEMAPGVGLAGQVFLTRQPLLLNRYGEVTRPMRPELADYTVIGLPIFWRGKMLGFFGIGSPPPRRFAAQDVETLTLFARHAAIAIENARLFEAEKRPAARIATINRIGRLINSNLDVAELLQVAVEAICEDLHLDSLSLILVDADDPDMLVLHAATGREAAHIPKDYRQSIQQGICGAAARTRQPVLLNDVSGDPRYLALPGMREIYAELAVPVLAGDRLLGVLNVESRQPIAQEEVADLEIVAHQLGVAIENAQLFEAEKRRAARLAIINRVARLIAASLNLDQLLQTAVEAISEYLYYHNVALLLVDPADPDTLLLRARSGIYIAPAVGDYRQPVDQGVIGAAITARDYLLINDVRRDARYIPIPGADNINAELVVPIIIGDRLLGALNIESEHRMSAEDAAGFKIIADQLGVAIDNARLFTNIQDALDQAHLLYETSQRISTAMGVDEVIQVYLEQVATRGDYACNIVLYEFDEAGERVAVIVHGRWTPQEGLVQAEERLPYTQDELDPPLDAGQTITIANVLTDPRVAPDLRQMQAQAQRPALALIPLMVREQRIGLVVLSYPVAYDWQAADLQPYQATAAQLATAIDSRRQHHLLSERGRQIAVLQERQRLARDLHDSVTQLIFSMTLIAQAIGPAWRRDPAEGERRMQRLLELSQLALAEMRALLAELRPPEPVSMLLEGGVEDRGWKIEDRGSKIEDGGWKIEDGGWKIEDRGSKIEDGGIEVRDVIQNPKSKIQNLKSTSVRRAVQNLKSKIQNQTYPLPGIVQVQRAGLVVALQQHIAQVAQDGLAIELNSDGYVGQPFEQEEALYRIAQEALNNVVKHARAQRVKLSLEVDHQSVYLKVVDNGAGFVLQPVPSPLVGAAANRPSPASGGLGLLTMRERAEALGGTIQLSAAPGRGTTVAVTIPRRDRE